MKYHFGRGTYLSMNYTHLNHDFLDNPNAVAWMVPERLGTLTEGSRRLCDCECYLDRQKFLKELKGLEVRGSVVRGQM